MKSFEGRVKEVLHRLLSEECSKIKKISEEITILNHQAQNFDKMFPIYQKEVLKDMFERMEKNGWNDWIKELRPELDALTNSEDKR